MMALSGAPSGKFWRPTAEFSARTCSTEARQREACDVMRGRAGGGEVGEDFADRGGELEAVSGAGRGDHDLGCARQTIDDEIAVGRHGVEAGLGLDQAPIRGRQML